MLKIILLLAFIILKISAQGAVGEVIFLNNSKSAKCLDGSPFAYVYFKGFGDGKDKFYIYMQGGGSCDGDTTEDLLESCFQRSKTILGSSKEWPETLTNTGNLSDDKDNNPTFYNWNKIYIPYCDGQLYQGRATISYKNTTLYFRGYDNVVEVFNVLIKKYDIQSSKIVVLSGGSAGGLGAFYWNQYLRKVINQNILVVAAPDSGFFIDITTQDRSQVYKKIDLITGGNRKLIQPEGCPYLYQNEQIYKCTYAQYIIDLMPVPVFIINSLYDTYILKNTLQVTCVTPTLGLQNCSKQDIEKVEYLRYEMLNQLEQVQSRKPNWGAWAISCIYHVFSESQQTFNGPDYQVQMNSGFTISYALKQFIQMQLDEISLDKNLFTLDSEVYPNNYNCNGLVNLNNKFLQNQKI
ncbi:hypothetical protein ABPG72_016584 [Tetrahymena utriculariae]